MSEEIMKGLRATYAAAEAAKKAALEVSDKLADLSSLRAEIAAMRAELAALKSRPAAPAQVGPEGGRVVKGRILEDARSFTSKNGKPLAKLRLKVDGRYTDILVGGRAVERVANLGEGSAVEIELTSEGVKEELAKARDGSQIVSKKDGQPVWNYSAFAEHVKVVSAEPITPPAAEPGTDYSDFGAPRRQAATPPPPVKVDPAGFADDDVPF